MGRRLWLWILAFVALVGASSAAGALLANRDDSADEGRASSVASTMSTTTTTPPTTAPPTTAPPATSTPLAPPTTTPPPPAAPEPLPPTTFAAPAPVDCPTLVADYFTKYKEVYGFTAAPSGRELVEHFTFAGRADCIDPAWRLPSPGHIIGESPPNTAGCASQRGVGSCPP
jgi:hypothetical protein